MTPRTNSIPPEVLQHPAAMDQGETLSKRGDRRENTPVFSSQQHGCCASDMNNTDRDPGQSTSAPAELVDEETFWSQAFGNGKDSEEHISLQFSDEIKEMARQLAPQYRALDAVESRPGRFAVTCAELPSLYGFGPSPEIAAEAFSAQLHLALCVMIKEGVPLPNPGTKAVRMVMISFRTPREFKAMYDAAAIRNNMKASDFYREAVDFALQLEQTSKEHECSQPELRRKLLGLLQACNNAAHQEQQMPLIDYLHDVTERIAAGKLECEKCCA